MTQVFVDTDVCMDYLSGRQPFTQEATLLFERIYRKRIRAHISSLAISNLYYILRRSNSHHSVTSRLEEFSALLDIMAVDQSIIKKAFKSEFKDFEDAIQHECARSNKKITAIITRNIRDYRKAQIPVLTPRDFLKSAPQ